jgi:hypothetical protein
MKRDTHHPDGDAGDVSRAYAQARFDEAPPPGVDRALLDAAVREARRGRRRLRPAHLAWAAALIVLFALVLELGVSPRSALDPPQTRASDGTADERASGGLLRAPTEPAPAARGGPARAVDAAMDVSAPARRAESAESANLGPALAPQETQADAAACTPAQRRTIDAWLACIEALRAAGDVAAAAREGDALELQHPNARRRDVDVR